jgi:hypothetical protein
MKARRRASRESVAVDPRLWATRRSHADARLRGIARGRDGSFREELARGVKGVDKAWLTARFTNVSGL